MAISHFWVGVVRCVWFFKVGLSFFVNDVSDYSANHHYNIDVVIINGSFKYR